MNLSKKIFLIFLTEFILFIIIAEIFGSNMMEKQIVDNLHINAKTLLSEQANGIDGYFNKMEGLGKKSAYMIKYWLRQKTTDKDTIDFSNKYKLIDGAIRSDIQQFEDIDISGVFLSSRTKINDSIKHIIMSTEGHFDDYAKAVKEFVFNMYFISESQLIRIYEKEWALKIEPEHDFTKDIFYYVADPEHNPQREPKWTSPYYDNIWHHWMTSLIIPIYIDGKFIGIVGHDIILDDIYKKILDKKYFKSGYGFIFDANKNIVVHPRYLNKLMETADMGTLLKFQDIDDKNLSSELEKIVNNNSDSNLYFDTYSEENITNHIFAKKLDFMNWYFALVIPNIEVNSKLSEFRTNFIIASLFLGLFLFSALFVLNWLYLVSPIRNLTLTTNEIIKGNLDSRVKIKSKDEIGELASAFNHMSGQLKTTLNELKQDIKIRQETEEALRLSEENYRNLFLNAKVGLVRVEQQLGTVTDCNYQSVKMFSYNSRKEFLNDFNFKKYYSVNNSCDTLFEEMEIGGYIINRETLFKNRNGEDLWVLMSINMISGSNSMEIVLLDISERKKAEEALRISEEKYRDLINNASESIIVAQDGYIQFANPKTYEMFGYTNHELASKPFPEFIYEEDRALVLERYNKRIEGEALNFVYDFRIITKNNETRWVEINAVLIKWNNKPATLNFLTDATRTEKCRRTNKKNE